MRRFQTRNLPSRTSPAGWLPANESHGEGPSHVVVTSERGILAATGSMPWKRASNRSRSPLRPRLVRPQPCSHQFAERVSSAAQSRSTQGHCWFESSFVQPSYRRVVARQCMLLPRMGTSAGGAAAKSAVERCDEPFHKVSKLMTAVLQRSSETPNAQKIPRTHPE